MKTRRSYIHLSKYHPWENPYLLKSVLLVYSNRCISLCETREILERAPPYHKDDTTEYSVSMLWLGRMHNSSQLSFDTLKNLCGTQDVRCYATEEQPSVGVINIWGVHFVSLSLCQSKCILEVMDYLSKWMKHFLCCGWLEEFKEDDSGNHISLLWISKSHVW